MKRPSIVIILFLLALGGICAATAWAWQDPGTLSQQENRYLSPFPELTEETWLSGEFAKGTEAFLADHIYHREALLDTAKRLEKGLERETDVKIVSQAVDLGQERPAGEQAALPMAVQTGEEQAEEQMEDRIILKDRILSTYVTDDVARNNYKRVLNAFFDLFPDTVTKASLLVPTRIAFEPEYAEYAGGQQADIQKVYKGLEENIVTVDLWEELEAGNVEQLYFRTDHHWTADGAYIGVKGYLEELGRSCVPKERYERRSGEPFLGYLYAQIGEESLQNHRDELIYYVHPDGIGRERSFHKASESGEPVPKQDVVLDPNRQGYYTFVDKNFVYAIIEGKAEDQSCLLLVGDSYCNAMAPWLSDNFGKVILVDPRDWTAGKEGLLALAGQEGVTDVLVADYVTILGNPWFTEQMEKLTR